MKSPARRRALFFGRAEDSAPGGTMAFVRSITRRAYAKINLALSVGGALPPGTRRAGRDVSGYHPIASWMAPIELWDEVRVTRGGGGASEVLWAGNAVRASPIDWELGRDLAVRAIRALESAAGIGEELCVRVEKRIPVGGGLGGGSSDAAAALLAGNALLDEPLAAERLAAIALSLGSDVAFFLDDCPPRPALVSGLGERVERIARVPGELLLIVPGFGCPTGAVYRAFDAGPPAKLNEARVRGLIEAGTVDPASLFNDLAGAACVVEPRLAAILAVLVPLGPVHVTGSGSCLFCFSKEADRARNLVSRVDPGAAVVGTRLV